MVFFLFSVYYLFITNIPHPWSSLVRSSLKWCCRPWPVEDGVVWLTHPANGPTDSLGFQLTVEPACGLVGHDHLDGCVVFGANGAIAGRACPRHDVSRSTNLPASVCMSKARLLLPPRAQKVASVLNWDFAKIWCVLVCATHCIRGFMCLSHFPVLHIWGRLNGIVSCCVYGNLLLLFACYLPQSYPICNFAISW